MGFKTDLLTHIGLRGLELGLDQDAAIELRNGYRYLKIDGLKVIVKDLRVDWSVGDYTELGGSGHFFQVVSIDGVYLELSRVHPETLELEGGQPFRTHRAGSRLRQMTKASA